MSYDDFYENFIPTSSVFTGLSPSNTNYFTQGSVIFIENRPKKKTINLFGNILENSTKYAPLSYTDKEFTDVANTLDDVIKEFALRENLEH